MYKFTILAFVAVCSLAAAKPTVENIVPIIAQESFLDNDGKYHYSYESGDGTKVHGSGEVKPIDKDHSSASVQGGFEFGAPDGQVVAIQYIADENGYQPTGDVIPKIPEAIVKSLEWNKAHPEEE